MNNIKEDNTTVVNSKIRNMCERMTDNSKRKILNQNSITKKWADELIEDELNGQKRIMVKFETYEALHDISKMNESYDEIIVKCIQAYKDLYMDKLQDDRLVLTSEEE